MKPSVATWRFPESNFGLFQDFNDNQTTHFTRAPINHLVRESVQNSIDAKESGGELVEISFSETTIPTALLDADNYLDHLDGCINIAAARGNTRAVRDYERAAQALDNEEIGTLRIQDTGTTGLSGQHWEALVSSQGAVHKNHRNGVPGGSFGVGKNVVFLFSSIHAVIYSTRYANRHEGAVQKFVGRAQLMSHPKPNSEDHFQPSGWMDSDRKPVSGRDIPNPFRLDGQGTAIFILGWDPPDHNWPAEIAVRTAQNFFYAIHNRTLKVSVSAKGLTTTIDHSTLEDLLTAQNDRESERFVSYYRATRQPQPPGTVGAKKSAQFDIQITAGEGPNRTAVVNRNGMFITDATSLTYNPLNLRHKSTWPDYAIVAMPSTGEADRWLRSMENPSHDSISAEQLREPENQASATNTFAAIRREIREIIDELAGDTAPGTTINVAELADVLPEVGDDSLGTNYEVAITPSKPSQSKLEIAEDGNALTEQESEGSTPGAKDIGPSDGPGGNGTGNDNENDPDPGDNPDVDVKDYNETPAKPVTVKHHRVIAADSYSAHVFLTAEKAAPIKIAVKPAGAEFRREPSITITGVQAMDPPDLPIRADLPADSFVITPAGEQRIHIELTFQSNIDNLALKIA